SHTYGLFFNGSASYEPADATVTLTVTKADTTVRAVTAKKIRTGKRANLVARVSARGFTPTGTVVVKRGSKVVGKATLKNGVARVKLAKLARGKARLTVTYTGSGVAKTSKVTVRTTVVKKKRPGPGQLARRPPRSSPTPASKEADVALCPGPTGRAGPRGRHRRCRAVHRHRRTRRVRPGDHRGLPQRRLQRRRLQEQVRRA